MSKLKSTLRATKCTQAKSVLYTQPRSGFRIYSRGYDTITGQ